MSRVDALDALIERIQRRGDTYSYFFDRVDDPRWLTPLAERGFFKSPIPIEHLEGGYVRFPAWPESRALARLAGVAPSEVLDLILSVPSTDNPRIHGDFIDA